MIGERPATRFRDRFCYVCQQHKPLKGMRKRGVKWICPECLRAEEERSEQQAKGNKP